VVPVLVSGERPAGSGDLARADRRNAPDRSAVTAAPTVLSKGRGGHASDVRRVRREALTEIRSEPMERARLGARRTGVVGRVDAMAKCRERDRRRRPADHPRKARTAHRPDVERDRFDASRQPSERRNALCSMSNFSATTTSYGGEAPERDQIRQQLAERSLGWDCRECAASINGRNVAGPQKHLAWHESPCRPPSQVETSQKWPQRPTSDARRCTTSSRATPGPTWSPLPSSKHAWDRRCGRANPHRNLSAAVIEARLHRPTADRVGPT